MAEDTMYVADTNCDDDKRLLHGGIDEAGVAIDIVADESDMSLAIGSAAAELNWAAAVVNSIREAAVGELLMLLLLYSNWCCCR